LIISRWKLEILYFLHWWEDRFEKVCEYKPWQKLVVEYSVQSKKLRCNSKNAHIFYPPCLQKLKIGLGVLKTFEESFVDGVLCEFLGFRILFI
jgi:hypothetical protein